MIKFIDIIFSTMKHCAKDMIIFPGKNLKPSLKYSFMIAVISTITYFLNLYPLIDFRGAWIATILLTTITFFDKEESNALFRMYGDANVLSEDNTKGEEVSNREVKDNGASDGVKSDI